MNRAKYAKLFGVLCVVFALFATILDGLTFIVPHSDFALKFNSSAETSQINAIAFVLILAFIGLLPLVFGLFSYYFANGIGDRWFSKILMTTILGIALLLPIAGAFDFLILSENSQKIVGLFLFFLYLFIVLTLLFLL